MMLLPYIVAFCIAYAVILINHNALHWETLGDFMSKFTLLLEEVTGALDLASYPLDAACKICEEISKTAKHPSMLDQAKRTIPCYAYPPDYRKIRSLFPSDAIYRRHPPTSEIYQLCSLHNLANRRFNVKSDDRDHSQLTTSHTRSVWAGYPPGTSRATEIIPIGFRQEPSSSTWRTSIGVSSQQSTEFPPASRTSLDLTRVQATLFKDDIGVSQSSLLIP